MSNSTGSAFYGTDGELEQIIGVPNTTGTPERRLLLAILERAILDLVGNESREVEEAEDWLFSDINDVNWSEDTHKQFSFSWICEQLDLDRKKISSKIRVMPRRGNKKVAPWYFSKSIMSA